MDTQITNRLEPGLHSISGFVLAGGRSSRLGQDKILLPWQGTTLLQHAIDRLWPLCTKVSICSSRADLPEKISGPYPRIPDAVPNAGPLAGIVPALEASQTGWNLFLAVDLPLVPVEFLRTLAQRAMAPALAIIPVVDTIPQPLCAMIHRSLAPPLRRALESGKYKVMLALREAMETPVPQLELSDARELAAKAQIQSALGVEHWFLNINTPQDWQRACALTSL